MTAEDLVSYMAEHEALHIIIDAKDDLVQVVSDLVQLSGETGVTDRFIIQLYGEGDKEKILKLYPFADENFLLTLYRFGYAYNTDQLEYFLELCYSENIRVITLPYGTWDQETIELFLSKNFVLFEHTVNRPDHANSSIQKGIHGLYTDFLQLDDLNLAARP